MACGFGASPRKRTRKPGRPWELRQSFVEPWFCVTARSNRPSPSKSATDPPRRPPEKSNPPLAPRHSHNTLIRGEIFQYPGKGPRHDIARPPGHNLVHRWVSERFDDIDPVCAAEIAEVNAPRQASPPVRIVAPVRRDDIQAAVAVKIPGGDAIPKPGDLAEVGPGNRTGHWNFPG